MKRNNEEDISPTKEKVVRSQKGVILFCLKLLFKRFLFKQIIFFRYRINSKSRLFYVPALYISIFKSLSNIVFINVNKN